MIRMLRNVDTKLYVHNSHLHIRLAERSRGISIRHGPDSSKSQLTMEVSGAAHISHIATSPCAISTSSIGHGHRLSPLSHFQTCAAVGVKPRSMRLDLSPPAIYGSSAIKVPILHLCQPDGPQKHWFATSKERAQERCHS